RRSVYESPFGGGVQLERASAAAENLLERQPSLVFDLVAEFRTVRFSHQLKHTIGILPNDRSRQHTLIHHRLIPAPHCPPSNFSTNAVAKLFLRVLELLRIALILQPSIMRLSPDSCCFGRRHSAVDPHGLEKRSAFSFRARRHVAFCGPARSA